MSDHWCEHLLGMDHGEDWLDSPSTPFVVHIVAEHPAHDPIYAFVYLTVEAFFALHEVMQSGESYMPGDYGVVLAAGSGKPSDELLAELSYNYHYRPS